MIFRKHWIFSCAALLMMIVLSACGGETGSTPPAPTTAPTTASTPTPAATTVVKTASVSVAGKTTTVLTDMRGLTLYYYVPDTSQKTACTGTCAQNWPPLLFSGSGALTSEPKLSGELGTYKNDNGTQVIYNDHPLYTYVGDKAPGDVTGEGKASGKWHVATPDLAKNT